MESTNLYIFTVLIGAFIYIYVLIKRIYSYWERRGFSTVPGVSYLFGHFGDTVRQKKFVGKAVSDLYFQSANLPYVGIYSILRPVLLVRDPELIRSILVKDFSYFTDRGVHSNDEYDPLAGNLFALPGQKWKNLRQKLTPTFTSGKLKAMFSTLLDCGSTLQHFLEKLSENGELLDAREIAASHATNVIASVAFGIDVDTINEPNNDFRVCGRRLFEPTLVNRMRQFLFFNAPKVMTFFRIKVARSDVESFLRSVTKQNVEYREKNNVTRKDFFQLLIQLRNAGIVQSDDHWETIVKENEKEMTLDEISAQIFLFFIAGFETSSTTLSFCLYEMAKNPDIQNRIHKEIDEILSQHNGNVTYESISDMKYLECCIDETLRKYPVLPLLNRSCVKDYKIPGTNQIIENGTPIFIPVMGLSWDEKYYPEPEKFNPDRFNEENSLGKNMINRPYLPFGEGPRNCIGIRLGKMQTKAGLVMMLQKFRFELADKHKNDKMELDPINFFMTPLNGIHLRVIKRK